MLQTYFTVSSGCNLYPKFSIKESLDKIISCGSYFTIQSSISKPDSLANIPKQRVIDERNCLLSSHLYNIVENTSHPRQLHSIVILTENQFFECYAQSQSSTYKNNRTKHNFQIYLPILFAQNKTLQKTY